jgi:hypothetical protein
MSPQSLYKQLFVIDTSTSKSFRSLGFVTHNNANSNKPSWLPDWAVATSCYHDLGLYTRHNLYSASKSREPDFDRELLEDGILHVVTIPTSYAAIVVRSAPVYRPGEITTDFTAWESWLTLFLDYAGLTRDDVPGLYSSRLRMRVVPKIWRWG